MKAQQIAIGYVNDFTRRVLICDNVKDYYDLVGAIFIFAEMVDIHFKKLYELDEENADVLLADLRAAARAIAEDIANNIDLQEEKENLN